MNMNKILLIHLCWSVFVCKIHLQVPVDEFTLTKTNYFHTETVVNPFKWGADGYKNRMCKGFRTFNLPDIKRNGHHGVEDNNVTPEAEESSVGGALVAAIVQIPGFGASLFVPEGMTNSQTRCHQDQQSKDLQGHTRS